MPLPSETELHGIVHKVVQRTLTGEQPARIPGSSSAAPNQPVPAPQPASQAEPKPPAAAQAVALGADHGGFPLKQALKSYVAGLGYQVIDCGTYGTDSVDYPDFAHDVARLVSEGRAWRGIVIDAAGIGSCMAANKVPGVRAAMCYDLATASNSREHNNANVLTLGAKMISENLARQIVNVWLTTLFGGDRHARRIDKITAIEKRYSKFKE